MAFPLEIYNNFGLASWFTRFGKCRLLFQALHVHMSTVVTTNYASQSTYRNHSMYIPYINHAIAGTGLSYIEIKLSAKYTA